MTFYKETQAFPSHLLLSVHRVVSILSKDQLHEPNTRNFRIFVEGEMLVIPSRVYYREQQILECIKLPDGEGMIALCLGTRHHNGYLREKCLEKLIKKTSEPWIIPYIIELMGEYILPILQIINRELPYLDTGQFQAFYIENKPYYATTCSKVVSYWNEFYRQQYPRWHDYPGYHLLKAFEKAPLYMQAINLPKF